jgi:hypothetical protein
MERGWVLTKGFEYQQNRGMRTGSALDGDRGLRTGTALEDCEKELGWQMEKRIENTVLMKRN